MLVSADVCLLQDLHVRFGQLAAGQQSYIDDRVAAVKYIEQRTYQHDLQPDLLYMNHKASCIAHLCSHTLPSLTH